MATPCEQTFLERLKTGDRSAYEILYRVYFPSIAHLVKRNNGNERDAEDLFQETILVLLEKIRQPDFEFTSSLKTYLYAIARNGWLKRLRDNKLITTSDDTYLNDLQDQGIVSEPLGEEAPEEQVHAWMATITDNCQRVLHSLYFSQEPMDSLMRHMGWKNPHTASNQKYKCIQQLKRAASQTKPD